VAAPHQEFALAEIPLPWLPPWQSKVVIIKLCVKIFRLPLLMRLMTCLCPAMSSGLSPPLSLTEWRANGPLRDWFGLISSYITAS